MKIINLDNCKNIRDISYNRIKENKLIRSSSLDKLSKKDIEQLQNKYKLKVVIDLRTNDEMTDERDVTIPNVEYLNIPLVNEETLGITHGSSTEEKLLNISKSIPDLCNLYTQFVTRNKKEQWTKIFDVLLKNYNGTILWHCKQGKDRCGVVSAIIEYCLGVDFEIIMKDYLMTNNYCIEKANAMYNTIFKITKNNETAEKIKDLFVAKEEYLYSTFDYIKKEYGSLDIFLNEMCGLNEEKINLLKSIYLKK